MSRLTKKLEPPYESVLGGDYIYTSNTRLTPSFASVEQKLGQLEDVEEELGIDLITLFKALRNGVYHKVLRGTKYETFYFDNVEFRKDKEQGWYLLVPTTAIMYIKDYGKTWELTKEELL